MSSQSSGSSGGSFCKCKWSSQNPLFLLYFYCLRLSHNIRQRSFHRFNFSGASWRIFRTDDCDLQKSAIWILNDGPLQVEPSSQTFAVCIPPICFRSQYPATSKIQLYRIEIGVYCKFENSNLSVYWICQSTESKIDICLYFPISWLFQTQECFVKAIQKDSCLQAEEKQVRFLSWCLRYILYFGYQWKDKWWQMCPSCLNTLFALDKIKKGKCWAVSPRNSCSLSWFLYGSGYARYGCLWCLISNQKVKNLKARDNGTARCLCIRSRSYVFKENLCILCTILYIWHNFKCEALEGCTCVLFQVQVQSRIWDCLQTLEQLYQQIL